VLFLLYISIACNDNFISIITIIQNYICLLYLNYVVFIVVNGRMSLKNGMNFEIETHFGMNFEIETHFGDIPK